jgi:hypothetical protein
MAKVLSEEQIFAADDLKREWVDTPEWDETPGDGSGVYVRMLMAEDQEIVDDELPEGEEVDLRSGAAVDFMATVAIMSAVNEDGEHIFTTPPPKAEPDAARQAAFEAARAKLKRKAMAPLMRIALAACKLNAMLKSEMEKMRADFLGTPDGDSDSSMPSPEE